MPISVALLIEWRGGAGQPQPGRRGPLPGWRPDRRGRLRPRPDRRPGRPAQAHPRLQGAVRPGAGGRGRRLGRPGHRPALQRAGLDRLAGVGAGPGPGHPHRRRRGDPGGRPGRRPRAGRRRPAAAAGRAGRRLRPSRAPARGPGGLLPARRAGRAAGGAAVPADHEHLRAVGRLRRSGGKTIVPGRAGPGRHPPGRRRPERAAAAVRRHLADHGFGHVRSTCSTPTRGPRPSPATAPSWPCAPPTGPGADDPALPAGPLVRSLLRVRPHPRPALGVGRGRPRRRAHGPTSTPPWPGWRSIVGAAAFLLAYAGLPR